MPFIPVGLLLLTSISCAEGQDNHPRPRDRAGQNLDAALGRQAARVRSERQLSPSRAQSCNSRGACEAMGCDFHTGMDDCRPCCGSRPTDTQATSRPTPPPPTVVPPPCTETPPSAAAVGSKLMMEAAGGAKVVSIDLLDDGRHHSMPYITSYNPPSIPCPAPSSLRPFAADRCPALHRRHVPRGDPVQHVRHRRLEFRTGGQG